MDHLMYFKQQALVEISFLFFWTFVHDLETVNLYSDKHTILNSGFITICYIPAKYPTL